MVRIDLLGVLAARKSELRLQAALAGTGIIGSFEEHLRPQLDRGALVPEFEDWWQCFPDHSFTIRADGTCARRSGRSSTASSRGG